TERPDQYFPYRFGESLWEYVGSRWGDAAIGEILQNATTLGIARAFQRQLGLTLHELSDDWREAMNAKYLPQAASLDRPRTFAQPLLTEKKSGGQIFLAPALSNDGNRIAFLSNGSFKRGEVFIDLCHRPRAGDQFVGAQAFAVAHRRHGYRERCDQRSARTGRTQPESAVVAGWT